MSKKILLLSSVIFLSSCAATNISELGDKFLDLINPSDAPAEVADLSEQVLVLSDDGGFTVAELEQLSNDELIAIAKEKGLEDMIVLDADGNLQNREQLINAIIESGDLMDGKSAELESLSDDALIEMAIAKGMGDMIELDADGNLLNRDELESALMADASKVMAVIEEFKNSGTSFILYFDYDDTGIDEVATRSIIEHANFMQNNPSVNVRLEGHADERGTREYNLALGENRALAVQEVLGLYNLEDRIMVVSYGEEQPVLVGSNEEAWEENRRVEFSYY
ncbi:OmpA family protein [Candidatus Thioglobus sp. NP1]|jgi:peptidoglycan-associated lipoprotein|uniref:OmpA family protein n=1 Tax=Candidatus Thioglobus sp. NP1 TaxID=2508687 RepID=UPI000DEDB639|nr:OmpA family protein [Candidatus Thioglobus sp. NP1]AXE62199.1 flagellar motor protein MotB [Candidatus Thioglobus sp. NP1]|tara:strand:- start:1136 stop:1978 length:843 start_codon:yes stop_codon:yes gene_type:complete